MRRPNWPELCLAALLGVAVLRALSLGSSLEIERARSNAYLARIHSMTDCDEAVKESRILYQRQLQLRNDSLNEAQNTKGYTPTNEESFYAGLY